MAQHAMEPPRGGPVFGMRGRRRYGERLIPLLLLLCGLVTVLITVGIVVSLLTQAVGFFSVVSLLAFFTDTKWTPLFKPQHFGIWPLIS